MLANKYTKKICHILAATLVVGSLLLCGTPSQAAAPSGSPEFEDIVSLRAPVRQVIFYREDVDFKEGEFIPRYRTITHKVNHNTYSGTIEATRFAGTFAEHTITITYEGTLYL